MLRYKAVTLIVTLATLAISVWLYVIIPKGFFPTEDTGFISASDSRCGIRKSTAMRPIGTIEMHTSA